MVRSIFFISDRTALTVESLGSALLTQFDTIIFKKYFIPFIDTNNSADQAILKIHNRFLIDKERPIVFTTIMNMDIRNKFNLEYVCHIDFFATFIPVIEQELQQKATITSGMAHGLENKERYANRINAIDFALSHDDGIMNEDGYKAADIILLGISRVGKTPTCLYLAVNHGIKSANYPLTEHTEFLPKFVLQHHKKLFALTIDSEVLQNIRNARFPNSKYSSKENCDYELSQANQLIRNHEIPFLNVSHKSIEEIAATICKIMGLKR